MSIKLSISGIRGKFHELVPNRVVKFAEAFSTYIGGGDVIIGRDARPSGKYISEAVIAGLNFSGANVYDCGITPTPMLQWIIKNSNFNGGISITAGHNHFDWNSLIFLNSDGSYLNHIEGEEFFNLFHSGDFDKKHYNELGTYSASWKPDSGDREYIRKYFDTFEFDGEPASAGKFVIDCSNGFDASLMENFAGSLKIHGIPIFCRQKGFMQKDPEPNIKNAAFLGTIVRETGSDGGFLLNSDASRVLVVDETGEPLSEELTMPLFARIILEEQRDNNEKMGDIVTNYSTSKIIDQVAKEFGSRVYRTEVGQPYVVQMVKDIRAVMGGEGSGSIIYSPFSLGFDSFMFIKKVVEYLRKKKCKISEIARGFAVPQIYKETIFLKPSRIYHFLEQIGEDYSGKITTKLKDGFYINLSDEDWLCIRASATVSMIRIVGEGKQIEDDIDSMKKLAE